MDGPRTTSRPRTRWRSDALVGLATCVALSGCGDAAPASDGGLPDATPDAGSGSIRISMRIFECVAGPNLPDVPVDIRALADPSTPVAAAVSDATGVARFELLPPAGRFFLSAAAAGYRDARFFPDDFIQSDPRVLRPGTMCLTPEALVDRFFAETGIEEVPGTATVVVKLLDASLEGIPGTVRVAPAEGVVIYGVGPDGAWDPSATETDTGIAYVANVPEGPIVVTATHDGVALDAEALAAGDALVGVNLRFP